MGEREGESSSSRRCSLRGSQTLPPATDDRVCNESGSSLSLSLLRNLGSAVGAAKRMQQPGIHGIPVLSTFSLSFPSLPLSLSLSPLLGLMHPRFASALFRPPSLLQRSRSIAHPISRLNSSSNGGCNCVVLRSLVASQPLSLTLRLFSVAVSGGQVSSSDSRLPLH